MNDQPSWRSSTLSQLAVLSVGCYLVGALYQAWKNKDIAGLKWAAEIFGAGYLASRKPGNGEPKNPA
jgi:hypothetical protein